ncbi:hypothetical protein C8R44DRAFT_980644 [Mycena epipterygia]|nr:hypothetical protein C8R44DRAFT_980644 [Mycena epipterygia]
MFSKLLSAVILTILVVAQGAVAVQSCGEPYDPPCPKGEFCCHPGPIQVGHPKPAFCTGGACPL